MLNDFFNLIFPKRCFACFNALLKHEKLICTACQYHLPKTNFHLDPQNKVYKVFWGRVNIEQASSYYFFSKGNKVQNLLHHIKYKKATAVAEKIGELYAFELTNEGDFLNKIDLIIPVPLHKRKQKTRGYNQSEHFAKGISKIAALPVQNNYLFRKVYTASQTKKGRFKRWQNVVGGFYVKNAHELCNKHILLVDDVITTGATIEACVDALKKCRCKVSVLFIACA